MHLELRATSLEGASLLAEVAAREGLVRIARTPGGKAQAVHLTPEGRRRGVPAHGKL